MAVYTTVAQLQQRTAAKTIAEWAYDAATAGELDTSAGVAAALADETVSAVIAKAISDASKLIDHYVNGRLDMSVSANQTEMEPMCARIALYYLSRRRFIDDERNSYFKDYQKAIADLRAIREGRLHVGVDPERPDTNVTSTTINTTKTFNDDDLVGY